MWPAHYYGKWDMTQIITKFCWTVILHFSQKPDKHKSACSEQSTRTCVWRGLNLGFIKKCPHACMLSDDINVAEPTNSPDKIRTAKPRLPLSPSTCTRKKTATCGLTLWAYMIQSVCVCKGQNMYKHLDCSMYQPHNLNMPAQSNKKLG